MVLYYGLFALEAANNSIAATTRTRSTTNIPRIPFDRSCLLQKQKYFSNSIIKMPSSSSSSSSNSWIYTEDLRKRFEERYADCRYIFVPIYIDRKSIRHNHSTTGISPQRFDRENSWIYSRSLRDRLFNSTSKISLPLTTNISSSACCVTNHGFMRDEIPVKKDFKSKLFKRSSSAKDRTTSTTNMSLSSSVSSFSTTNNLVKHRTSDVVEEEDDEGVANENHSIPLIEHDSMVPSTSRPAIVSSIDNNFHVKQDVSNDLVRSSSAFVHSKSSIKDTTTRNKKFTRLRSFFFRRSTSSHSHAQQQQQQQQQPEHQQMTLSNRISRT